VNPAVPTGTKARQLEGRAGFELRPEEREQLLAGAREALAAHFAGRAPVLPPASGALAVRCGAFVTLRRAADGELRGCIGQMDGDGPLVETVAEMAVAAATRDARFSRISADELGSLRIEISVLSPLAPIAAADVEVGRHGLLVACGGRRGVLLPQVPGEYGWDRETFLRHTCEKAGLPPDSWKRADAELLGFTAVVFSEPL
jgi:AmmeMemoRadiSam system protein A